MSFILVYFRHIHIDLMNSEKWENCRVCGVLTIIEVRDKDQNGFCSNACKALYDPKIACKVIQHIGTECERCGMRHVVLNPDEKCFACTESSPPLCTNCGTKPCDIQDKCEDCWSCIFECIECSDRFDYTKHTKEPYRGGRCNKCERMEGHDDKDSTPICNVCDLHTCTQKSDGTFFPTCSITCGRILKNCCLSCGKNKRRIEGTHCNKCYKRMMTTR